MSAVVTEAGDREDEWVVRVKWSEVNSSCNGSVSQYMLCLTLPTSDSLSDSVCIITEHTKHNLTLTANARYVVSVKSVACSNISGPEREQTMIRLNGNTPVQLYLAIVEKCRYDMNTLSQCFYRSNQGKQCCSGV